MSNRSCQMEGIPQEMLDMIVMNLDANSSISLSLTSNCMICKLHKSKSFWKHLCRKRGIDFREWRVNVGQEDRQNIEFWRNLYQNAALVNNNLTQSSQLPAQRILLDLTKIGSSKNLNTDHHQKIVEFPLELNVKAVHSYKTLRKKLISESIICYGVSDLFFILIVSNCQTYQSSFSVWSLRDSNVVFQYSLSPLCDPPSPLTQLWLACSEDVLVVDHLLILLASPAKTSPFYNEASPLNSDILTVFDLDRRRTIARYRLQAGFVRFLPIILKDGGGSKILHWNGLLVVLCPEVNHRIMSTNFRFKCFIGQRELL